MHEHQRLDAILDQICIPMVCTYSSKLFIDHTAETAAYLKAFTEECHALEAAFSGHAVKTTVEVILMLLPIPSKDELTRCLDERLKHMQSI
jgi:hypothetical protein